MDHLLNQEVAITNKKSGARYYGVLCGFRHKENKFCLKNLRISNKEGGIIASMRDTVRWFNKDKFHVTAWWGL